MNTVNVRWNEGMEFTSEVNGSEIIIDAKEEFGGKCRSQTETVDFNCLRRLHRNGCCFHPQKMRVQFDTFNVKVEGELTDEHPNITRRSG